MRQTGSVNKNHVLFTDTFWKDGCLGKQEMGTYTTNKKGCQTNFCWPFFFLGNYDENCWNPQYFTIFLNLKVEHKTSLVIIPQLFRKYKNLPWHLGPIGNNAGCELRNLEFILNIFEFPSFCNETFWYLLLLMVEIVTKSLIKDHPALSWGSLILISELSPNSSACVFPYKTVALRTFFVLSKGHK